MTSFSINIYVQDNASTDQVENILSSFPYVNLHRNPSNLGFAKAVNQALRLCRGEYVILLNPDTYVTEGFFDAVTDFMEKNKNIGVMGPRILDSDGKLQNSARSFPTPLTALFGRSSYISKRFPKNPITGMNLLSLHCDGKTPMNVDWVSGACMIVRKKAIAEVGMLDERFFMYWEDTDWCRRMGAAGWKIVYFPRAVVYHYVGGSSEKRAVRSVLEFHKSVYLLFVKYLHPLLRFTKPVAFGCLAFRCAFIILLQLFKDFKSISTVYTAGRKEIVDEYPAMARVKILRMISRLNIGGPAIHVYLLNKALNAEKFESILATGNISQGEGDMRYLFRPEDPQPLFIPELQREISFRADIKSFFRIFKLILHENPDIVHTHTAKAGTGARMSVFILNEFGNMFRNAAERRRILTVHTFHGNIFEGYFGSFHSMLFMVIERLLASMTDILIAISQNQKKILIEKYHIGNDQKIRIIELGLELSPFFRAGLHRKDMKAGFRHHYGIPEDVVLIGIVGRLVPIKNHQLFLRAAKQLLENDPDTSMQFVVVGDGDLRRRLEAYCEALGITAYVKFTGWVKDMPMVYAGLDLLALTSSNEGTPVSIIEAMAASVPVISTDVGGVCDLLGKSLPEAKTRGFVISERGVLCHAHDADGFIRGLSYLIHEDRIVQQKRIQAARRYAEHHFDKDRLIRDIESLYEDLMKKRR